jgi:hypothetical protein
VAREDRPRFNTSVSRTDTIEPPRLRWLPGQHGAWAMLAVPLLLGIAASRPDIGQLPLAGAAVSGYLAMTSAQGWLRGRQQSRYRLPLVVYATAFLACAAILALLRPSVLAAALVLLPAGVLILAISRLRHPRSLLVALLEVLVALVLVPTAASAADPSATVAPMTHEVAKATLVAGIYLAGSVLVVRSVIRERERPWFAIGSVAAHLLALPVTLFLISWPYGVLVGLLALRAALVPLARRWLLGRGRQLRPVQVGMVELACAIGVVVLGFLSPP